MIGEGSRGIFEQCSGKNAVDFCFLPSRIMVVKIRAENLMKNTELFSNKARVYAASRPGYARDAVLYLISLTGVSAPVIADVGSGTGIFSQSLLEDGADVFAVEPNDDMRQVAEEKLKHFPLFHSVRGSAESTTLADCSVDMITAATSFHWFDFDGFKRECRRIAKPGAKAAIIYNHQQKNDFTEARHEIVVKYCSHRSGFDEGRDTFSKIESFFAKGYDVKEIPNNLQWDEDGFVARCCSSSFSLLPEDERFEEYENALRLLFRAYAKDDVITLINHTRLFVGDIA